ncbi:MAG: HPr family phosphocarrier protein, partial [Betaproteobacteria bacterium]|nr:HPr family phosphocarrier protein [Betaproteobacteria bacterium]
MIRASAVIVNSRGLHARPSSQLAKLAAGFSSKIVVAKGRQTADAASISSLLMLAAPKNTELTITAKGRDEKIAAAAVLELIAGGFGDGVDSPAVAENPPAADIPPARAMQKIDGIGASAGTACGVARIRTDNSETPRYTLSENKIAAEQKRFDAALKKARAELAAVQKKIAGMDGAAEMSPFAELYRNMLEDPELIKTIHAAIAKQKCNAEWAVQQRADAVSARFLHIEDSYLRGRGEDVRHVMRRLLAAMKPGGARKSENTAGLIVVAAELDPAHVITLRRRGFAGFATETGGGASHTAILARSIGMPAIVGAKGLLAAVQNGDDIVLDMDNHAVVVRPDPQTLAEYQKIPPPSAAAPPTKTRRGGGVQTADGKTVLLQANMELPDETRGVLESRADGIGLFRTEFLFLNR